jgi:hypothetical protein
LFFKFTAEQLKKYSYGKHILAHLEKTIPDSNRVRLVFPARCFVRAFFAECSRSLAMATKEKAKVVATKVVAQLAGSS